VRALYSQVKVKGPIWLLMELHLTATGCHQLHGCWRTTPNSQ